VAVAKRVLSPRQYAREQRASAIGSIVGLVLAGALILGSIGVGIAAHRRQVASPASVSTR
jgi:hypothetical protein